MGVKALNQKAASHIRALLDCTRLPVRFVRMTMLNTVKM